MSTESEVLELRARVAELESRVDYLYNHLGVGFIKDTGTADAGVIEMLKKGHKIEAIKIYREIYNCGIAAAKNAVEEIEANLGL